MIIHPSHLFPHIRGLNPAPAQVVVERSKPQFEARRKAIDAATEPYSLVLDDDVTVPNEFISESSRKLINQYTACTMFYDGQGKHTKGIPPFSPSLWVTSRLKELYDYQAYLENYKTTYTKTEDAKGNTVFNVKERFLCECEYMWTKLKSSELYIFENMKANHHKQMP